MFLSAQLAAIGGINFDSSIRTAGVSESKLYINEGFWNALNDVEKNFLLDHEMSHLVLRHHSKIKALEVPLEDFNNAADLAINSMLADQYFGAQDPKTQMPTLFHMGLFPSKFNLPAMKSTEFYLDCIKNNSSLKEILVLNAASGNLNDGKLSEENEQAENACGEFKRDLSDFSKKISEMISRENPSFEKYMKDLVGNSAPLVSYNLNERWTYNRRMSWSNLPAEVFSESHNRARKNKVGLFLDYSGSCSELIKIFERAAGMIPARSFAVSKFRFASSCAPWGSKENIGYGTNFNSMIEFMHGFDQVWIFSDGDGYAPNFPTKNCIWFLGGSIVTAGLPKQSKIVNLNLFVDITK